MDCLLRTGVAPTDPWIGRVSVARGGSQAGSSKRKASVCCSGGELFTLLRAERRASSYPRSVETGHRTVTLVSRLPCMSSAGVYITNL